MFLLKVKGRTRGQIGLLLIQLKTTFAREPRGTTGKIWRRSPSNITNFQTRAHLSLHISCRL